MRETSVGAMKSIFCVICSAMPNTRRSSQANLNHIWLPDSSFWRSFSIYNYTTLLAELNFKNHQTRITPKSSNWTQTQKDPKYIVPGYRRVACCTAWGSLWLASFDPAGWVARWSARAECWARGDICPPECLLSRERWQEAALEARIGPACHLRQGMLQILVIVIQPVNSTPNKTCEQINKPSSSSWLTASKNTTSRFLGIAGSLSFAFRNTLSSECFISWKLVGISFSWISRHSNQRLKNRKQNKVTRTKICC